MQKVLAAAGIGSRRDCEELILEGRVEVDGKIVEELGTRVDPVTQRIRVDGTTLPAPKRVYYVLNKPTGVLCTNNDPSGRQRAVDLVRSNERLFTVGRLDQGSQGLILLTNDGELSNKLTHPRYGIEKVYRVHVAGVPDNSVLGKLKRGIHFSDGFAKVSSVKIKSRQKQSAILEIVLNEGRNREIRRLLARIGHKVLSLTRTAMGPLRLSDLPSGAHRRLTREEVKQLRNAVLSAKREDKPTSRRNASTSKRKSPASPKRSTTNSRSASDKPASRKGKTTRTTAISDHPAVGAVLGGDESVDSRIQSKRKKRPSTRKTSSKGRRSNANHRASKAKRKGRR